MFLKKFELKASIGKEEAWAIAPCAFHKINMLVGRNATGKTRLVSGLHMFSGLLIGELKPNELRKNPVEINADFGNRLEENQYSYQYTLAIDEKGTVVKEILYDNIEEKKLIQRENDSKKNATIWSVNLNDYLQIDVQNTELIAYKKLDRIQHPFLENLFSWANDLRFYSFGTEMGRMQAGNKLNTNRINFQDDESNYIVEIFIEAYEKYGSEFRQKIKDDMEHLFYFLDEINVKPAFVRNGVESDAQFIYLKERGTSGEILQLDLSQGMFRCLSLIIQLNYFILTGKKGVIIIDDVGEGLDFSRSKNLIKLLCEKIAQTNCQLIMTSNDEYTINGVDLEDVIVLYRPDNGGIVQVYNYENSKDAYDDFYYTSLNNFNFLHLNYFLKKDGYVEN